LIEARAIKSALEQTYPCEVIVVDDCSADSTEEYLKNLGNQVVYLRNCQNLGHSASVNRGVEVAQGEWIKLLDDDDYLASNCIEQMSEAIASSPDTVICSCQAIQVDNQGSELKKTSFVGSQTIHTVFQEDIHYQMLMEMLPFGTPVQVAFQKEAFQKAGGWDSAFDSNYDDIDAWIRIAQYGDAVFINQCLAYRTIWLGGTAINLSLEDRLQKNIEIKEKMYQLVSEKYQLSVPKIEEIKSFLKLYWSFVGLKNGQLGEAFKILSSLVFSVNAFFHLMRVLSYRKSINYEYLDTSKSKSAFN